MTESFAEIVDSFENDGQKGIFVQRRDSRIGVLDVFAARKIESGLEALLVKTQPALLPRIEDWPLSEGFHVEIRPSRGRPGFSLICLELSAPEFRDVFLALAEDICSVLLQESDPGEAIRSMLRRLFHWQAFLRKHRPDGLSEEARTGLFGELEVLKSLFLGVLEDSRAVAGWRGCMRANQDFQYPAFALEVKTTRSATPDHIHISNVRQLDEEGIDTMFLYLLLVEQNESAGVSLPDIVAEVRSRIDGHALDLFNEGLVNVGYLDVHEPSYKKDLYQVKEMIHFAVREGFPRMISNQVPPGVEVVKYRISIDLCRPFRVEQTEVLDAVQKLKNKLENE